MNTLNLLSWLTHHVSRVENPIEGEFLKGFGEGNSAACAAHHCLPGGLHPLLGASPVHVFNPLLCA